MAKEYKLNEIKETRWERIRDNFIERIASIGKKMDSQNLENVSALKDSRPSSLPELLTDDEKIIAYFFLKKDICEFSLKEVQEWLIENEIHEVNIKNGFKLLAELSLGEFDSEKLSLGTDFFRKMIKNKTQYLNVCSEAFIKHKRLSVDVFQEKWKNLQSNKKLLAAYIASEKINSLGARWKTSSQIESIKVWENKVHAGRILSNSYNDALHTFIENGFVYACEWTDHGNAREYGIYNSLKKYLHSGIPDHMQEINDIIDFEF